MVKACKSFAEHVKPWLDKCSGKFLHSERCACSSSAKQGEQVKPSSFLLTLCTAGKSSLGMVLTHTHTLPASRQDGGDTGTAGHSSLPRGPAGRCGRGRRASLSRVNHKHHQDCHLGTPSLHDDTTEMHHNTGPWSGSFDNWMSFKGVKGNWLLTQRTWEHAPEKEESHLTLLTFCEMEHHQEALLWDSLRKDKATPYKSCYSLNPVHINTAQAVAISRLKAHGQELGWTLSRQPSQEPHQNMPTRKHSTLLL